MHHKMNLINLRGQLIRIYQPKSQIFLDPGLAKPELNIRSKNTDLDLIKLELICQQQKLDTVHNNKICLGYKTLVQVLKCKFKILWAVRKCLAFQDIQWTMTYAKQNMICNI